ncbi:MAG: hypothetical protein KAY21_02860 [Limnohabitans sp.]|nr:hypothetical protein [Limnohabitans sp.]
MSAANSLRLMWMQGINNPKGPRTLGTEKFLSTKNVTPDRISEPSEVALYVGNPKRTHEYFCHEADRFASASFETLISNAPVVGYERSTAWQLIRGYYAAFFSVHALLRLHGVACTRITATTTTPLNREVQRLHPGSHSMAGGLYYLRSKSGGTEMYLTKFDSNAGGSHEALWALLTDYLRTATQKALLDTTDQVASATFATMIDKFNTVVKKHGGPMWFTQVRNRINYSHGYGSWFPHQGSTTDTARIASYLECWRKEPSESLIDHAADELTQFAQACSFLVSMCRVTINDVAHRSAANSPIRQSSARLAAAV